jgi:hypothetical protein
MEYQSAFKKEEILPYKISWMNMESEITWSQKDK